MSGDVLDVLRWVLIAVLFIYFVVLMYGLGGMLTWYAIEGRKGFYAAHVARTGVSVDRLEWVLILNHLCWPVVWARRDPHFFAARLGTLSKAAEADYEAVHPKWKARRATGQSRN